MRASKLSSYVLKFSDITCACATQVILLLVVHYSARIAVGCLVNKKDATDDVDMPFFSLQAHTVRSEGVALDHKLDDISESATHLHKPEMTPTHDIIMAADTEPGTRDHWTAENTTEM